MIQQLQALPPRHPQHTTHIPRRTRIQLPQRNHLISHVRLPQHQRRMLPLQRRRLALYQRPIHRQRHHRRIRSLPQRQQRILQTQRIRRPHRQQRINLVHHKDLLRRLEIAQRGLNLGLYVFCFPAA